MNSMILSKVVYFRK